ncbi:MAG TPA: dephospho-CoA kinase [Usitatibacter sp.]|nr:dephospho-CoA kinase [Usitatibacter sp.]
MTPAAGPRPVIGLTGGIGSGKSTVAERLRTLGADLVDTDAIAHELTAPGGAAMPALKAEFGDRFVGADGALDRAAMRALAFQDASARARLESLLHPRIRERAEAALARAAGPYALLAVPLLLETRGYAGRVSRVLVVDCPEELQVSRVVARSGLDPSQVRAIMHAQWPRWRRLQAADDVVWNGGDMAATAAQCEMLHRIYSGGPLDAA